MKALQELAALAAILVTAWVINKAIEQMAEAEWNR